MTMIHDSMFDIQDDYCTKSDTHYRVHPDVYRHIKKLEAIASAAQSLMSEDGAKAAVAHYSCLHVLEDKLLGLESP